MAGRKPNRIRHEKIAILGNNVDLDARISGRWFSCIRGGLPALHMQDDSPVRDEIIM